MSEPIPVTVTVRVDIDPEAWAANYGVEGRRAIRADVQTYAENLVREQLRDAGVLR